MYLDVLVVLDELLVVICDMELVRIWVRVAGFEQGLDSLGAILVVHTRVHLFLVILLLVSGGLRRGGGSLLGLLFLLLTGLLALLELVLGDLATFGAISTRLNTVPDVESIL